MTKMFLQLTVESTIGGYVGAVYDWKAYIGMVNDMHEDEVEIFYRIMEPLTAKQSLNGQKKQTMSGYHYQLYSALYPNPPLRNKSPLKCVRTFCKV